jgi:hypothetical protein
MHALYYSDNECTIGLAHGVVRKKQSSMDLRVKTTLNSTRERQHIRSRQGYKYTEVRCRWKMVVMRGGESERQALPLFSFTLISPVLYYYWL